MAGKFSRRSMLKAGAAAAGGAALFPIFAGPAQAARERITVRMMRDIQSLDPANRVSYVEGNVMRAVLQGLISFKPGKFEWELDAAKSITQVSPTLIEFELKPGLMFHGGYGEVTAEDVKFSFERYIKPMANGQMAQYAKDWEALKEVEVTGKYTGKIHLKNPAPAIWLVNLPDGSGSILSKAAYEKLGDQATKSLIGSGPYILEKWEPNQRIILKANPEWKGQKVAFNEVILKPVADPKTAELAFRSGELDFTVIEPAAAKEMAKLADTDVISLDSINFVWIGINVSKPPFDNLKVRQAIRLAIDVDRVILAAYNGAVTRAYSLIAPGLLGYWADAPKYKRDIDAAKKLMAEAGHEKGFECKLTLLNRPAFQAAGLVVQAMLANLGIKLNLEVLDGGTFWSAGKGDAGKNLDLSIQRFGGKADPAFQTQWFVSEQVGVWNWQRWASPEFDKLNVAAASTDDANERARLYIELQKVMDQSAAYIWLTHEVNVFASKKWLRPAILPNGDDLQLGLFREA